MIFKWDVIFFQRHRQIRFRAIPGLVATDTFFRASRQFDDDLLEAKGAIHIVDHTNTGVHFIANLIFSTEDMRIILGKAANAHQTMQRARRFVTVAATEFRHTQRQVAVGFQPLVEDLHVTRAVHRLDTVFTVLRRGGEHRIFVVVPVAGFFPQHTVHHERTFYFLILVLFQFRTNKRFQFTEDGPAVIVPEHHPRRLFLHVIQVELLTDFTVVTLGGFFQTLQVGIQRFFICPRGAVDTLQHFIVAVAAPVGSGGFHQLKVMAEAHVRYVRTAAHIDIFFMMIQARLVIMGNVFIKNRNFIAFAAFHEGFTRFMPAHFLLDNVVVFLGELMHTFFERVDIFLGQGVVEVYVIVETIIDNRTDSHFGVGPQLFDGMA